jgi:hypothetical protein
MPVTSVIQVMETVHSELNEHTASHFDLLCRCIGEFCLVMLNSNRGMCTMHLLIDGTRLVYEYEVEGKSHCDCCAMACDHPCLPFRPGNTDEKLGCTSMPLNVYLRAPPLLSPFLRSTFYIPWSRNCTHIES